MVLHQSATPATAAAAAASNSENAAKQNAANGFLAATASGSAGNNGDKGHPGGDTMNLRQVPPPGGSEGTSESSPMLVTRQSGAKQAPVTTVLNPRNVDYKHQIPSNSNHQRSHSWITAPAPGNGAATPSVHSGVRTSKGSLKSRCLSKRPRTRLEKALTLLLLCSLVLLILLCFRDFLSSNKRWSSVFSSSDAPQRTPFQDSYIQTINDQQICLSPQCVQTASYLLGAMDPSANPCQDFFQFACGSWNRKHVIPEDRSSISTFEVMADQLQIILKGILEEDKNDQDNEATVKAKHFFQSCMDIGKIADVSDAPLRTVIKQLGGWPVVEPGWSEEETLPLEEILGLLKRNFTLGVLIEEWVGPDDRDSKRHIIQIDQMQLGLPSRDYFLHLESEKDLEAYHQYMTDVATLLGANRTDAEEQLWKIVELEQTLANISVPEEDRLDTGAIYTQLSIDDLQLEVPEINWALYFDQVLRHVPYNGSEHIVSYSMPYFRDLGRVLAETDSEVVHNYVIWRLVMDLMPHMPPQYEKTRAEFRKVLLGVLVDRNRWNRCVEWTNKKMGMAVGALFIRDNFNYESKATALEMIHEIREAFNDLLEDNEWMDTETRAVAKDKANSMNERIGYPEYITNTSRLEAEYGNLRINRDTFLENLFHILGFEAEKNVDKLREPVDKDRWATEPAVVNAFYNPNKNDIVFPAGILQPLFYSQHFPKSLNYGGIGVVIGHEITHGFDDKGRQFDKQGNLKQWWNNRTIAEFREAAQCIVDQYSSYKLEEINLPINGRMTQGENIADNGGLKQAFRAYHKWVDAHGQEPLLPGLNMTHDQLFFLNYAQIWCGSMRPEDALTKIRSSVHSPGPIRVLGPLSNSWDFANAFKCPPGSRMNPTKKCSVW